MPDLPEVGGTVLYTERLVLRRFRMDDAEAYHEMMTQPGVEAMLGKGPATVETAGRQMATFEGYWALRGYSMLAVEERATRLLVGRVGPWMPHGWPDLEIGWTIHPRRWRMGYAVEAARACAIWCFERTPDRARVIHLIREDNTASQGVARALGATDTGATFRHPLGGLLRIWETQRSAVV